jgi:hypothetical protein
MESKETIKSDEVGSLEDALGKDDAVFQDDQNDSVQDDQSGENTVTEGMKDDAPAFTPDPDKPEKDVPLEVPIEYLMNPENNNKVFDATEFLLKRKDLIPCTKEGKKVYDHRIF